VPRSHATFSIAVPRPACELAFRPCRLERAETEIPISALFPAPEQGYASQCKSPHSMVRIPRSPPHLRFLSVVFVRSRTATLRAIMCELCKDQLSPFVLKGENACR
jgi:hypothetical protein